MGKDEFKQQVLNYIAVNNIDSPFNDRLSIEEITDFEEKNNLTLPEEYKFFLSEMGNGGFGPGYGILKLEESIIDFKLDSKPYINLSKPYKYSEEWNADWITSFDWDRERPELNKVNQYMSVEHISGTLQISHYGHGCTNLIVVNGLCKGEIWFDSRADYGGLIPETDDNNKRYRFFDWYINWLENR